MTTMGTTTLENYPAVVEAVRAMEKSASAFKQKVSLRWLRNCTLEAIEPYLRQSLYQERISCDLAFGGYDTILQDLESPGPQAPGVTHSATVLAVFGDPDFLRDPEVFASPAATVACLEELFAQASARCPHLLIVNTWIPPLHVAKVPGETRLENCVRAANTFIRDYVRRHPTRFALADWERIALSLGEAATFDYRFRYSAKAPFTHQFLKMLAIETARILRLACGRIKKCLVLDCDGTLWGGILGEDGPASLQLDPFDYPGNVFHRFQENILALHERGVLLCLCSKNDEEDLFQYLENNPSCPIKKQHLAGWRVNWDNKAKNISDLAVELNLGLDSFIFVDDSAAECELIRQALPEVTVLQVPGRIYELPDLIERHGYFDSLATTAEDRERTAQYQVEGRRREVRTAFADLEQYLRSLELKAQVREAAAGDLPRVAQLVQKTNQFNLTTIRHPQADLEKLVDAPDAAVFFLRPSDRFGDYGITGVLIARREGAVAGIDTLLLSCRILERRLEYAFVAEVFRVLETRWPVQEWHATYSRTEKNKIVANFWDSLKFVPLEQGADRKTYSAARGAWSLPCETGFISLV
jgi:FkbH-like protein